MLVLEKSIWFLFNITEMCFFWTKMHILKKKRQMKYDAGILNLCYFLFSIFPWIMNICVYVYYLDTSPSTSSNDLLQLIWLHRLLFLPINPNSEYIPWYTQFSSVFYPSDYQSSLICNIFIFSLSSMSEACNILPGICSSTLTDTFASRVE